MHKVLLTLIATVILQACAQMPATSGSSVSAVSTSYQPGAQEQFVFPEVDPTLQKYGYRNFCKNTKTFACTNKLDYQQYVGMKGYFKTNEPAHHDMHGYDFWPVMLENGKEFFYVSKAKFGGKYGSMASIIPLKKQEEVNSFEAVPLVDGSTVQVVGMEHTFGRDVYKLSTGKMLSKDELEKIRQVAGKFLEKGPAIAELLVDFEIKYDQVEDQYFMIPKTGSILKSEALLYIGMKPNKTWLRMKVKYYGDDWLFVRAFKVAADDHRWQSPQYEFRRDHSSGSVWEWVDKNPGTEELAAMKALSAAQSPIIRFQGRDYYKDFTLSPVQQNGITQALSLYDLVK